MILLKIGTIQLLLASMSYSCYKLLTEDLDGIILFCMLQGTWIIFYLTALVLIDYFKGDR